MNIPFRKKEKNIEDVLIKQKEDRRLLSNVPDEKGIRNNLDRRGTKNITGKDQYSKDFLKKYNFMSTRYLVESDVKITCIKNGKKIGSIVGRTQDISPTGMLVVLKDENAKSMLEGSTTFIIKTKIEAGKMPEGFESKIKGYAKLVRTQQTKEDDRLLCGFEFSEDMFEYFKKRKDRYLLVTSSFFLFFISAVVMLMRAESVIYFKYNRYLYFYSIITAVFLLSRYFFGGLYKPIPINPDFTPGVTIVIPCFNEEKWISKTIISCINQNYPVNKLEVIVVDDCSNDNSVEQIKETIEKLYLEDEHYKTKDRVSYVVQDQNKGKREALAIGTNMAKHELVVFVDSDSFLDPYAIRNLVQPLRDPKVGGVTGRTDVANTYTNTLTKMQSVRYYIAFRIMKAAEAYFDAATCLSGPLSCYRKELVLKNMDAWLNQKFLGQKATFGDDRSLTNFILKTNRTYYQDTAICHTIVPNQYSQFLKQQMRWKRSWLRESIIAGSFIWKKEPFMSLFFYMGLMVPIAAPIVVIYNLVYVPIAQRVFPTTFMMGILTMALLMSFAQMFFRKSSTWIYGVFFCIYYEVVLLWQMPIAWFTFWKSTWGTRMTPKDIEEQEKKEERKNKKRDACNVG